MANVIIPYSEIPIFPRGVVAGTYQSVIVRVTQYGTVGQTRFRVHPTLTTGADIRSEISSLTRHQAAWVDHTGADVTITRDGWSGATMSGPAWDAQTPQRTLYWQAGAPLPARPKQKRTSRMSTGGKQLKKSKEPKRGRRQGRGRDILGNLVNVGS